MKLSKKIINDKLLNLEKDNKILFEKISKVEKLLENNNKSNLVNIINHTIILNKKDEMQKTLANWIKQKTGKMEIKCELIFRKSVNGSYSEDFHKYCDNKGPTLTFIETENNQIIGGFTPLNWFKEKN